MTLLAALGASALFLTLSDYAASGPRARDAEPIPTQARSSLADAAVEVAAAKIDNAEKSDAASLSLTLTLPAQKPTARAATEIEDDLSPVLRPASAVGNDTVATSAERTGPPSAALVLQETGPDGRLRHPLVLPRPTRTHAAGKALASADPTTALELVISRGDTLDGLFGAHGLSRADLARILRLDEARRHLQLLRPDDRIAVRHAGGRLVSLDRVLDEERVLRISRAGDAFTTEVIVNPVERRNAHSHGVIESSLFRAAQKAGISDTLIMELAGVFAWDIDFVLDIRRGDQFTVLYEEIWQDGEKLRDGDILAAEFVNSGTTFRAVRFEDPDGDVGYFTPDGHNVKKAFLRAPIAITPRVTSNFNPRRLHPVHKKVRPHRGVDYGAPSGTPIKAAGDGKVLFRGRKGSYGNAVILQHGGNITTLYAHMSRFHKRARVGQRVKQGQTIGYVGATGTVTAAHLHYEYRVGGVHRNPRTVKLPKAQPVANRYRDAFLADTAPLLERLDRVGRVLRVASSQQKTSD